MNLVIPAVTTTCTKVSICAPERAIFWSSRAGSHGSTLRELHGQRRFYPKPATYDLTIQCCARCVHRQREQKAYEIYPQDILHMGGTSDCVAKCIA